jgi:hypothetical protein
MVTANIFDHAKRERSFEIVAQVHGGMKAAPIAQPEPQLSAADQS